MPDVHPRRLREQPPLGFELDAPDEQIAAVSHVGADRTLHARSPATGRRGCGTMSLKRIACTRASAIRLTRLAPEIHRNRRHRGADHPEQRVANQRPRRGRPGQRHAGPQIPPHSGGTAPRGGRNVHRTEGTRAGGFRQASPIGSCPATTNQPRSSTMRRSTRRNSSKIGSSSCPSFHRDLRVENRRSAGIGVAEVNRRNLTPSTLPCARTPAAA